MREPRFPRDGEGCDLVGCIEGDVNELSGGVDRDADRVAVKNGLPVGCVHQLRSNRSHAKAHGRSGDASRRAYRASCEINRQTQDLAVVGCGVEKFGRRYRCTRLGLADDGFAAAASDEGCGDHPAKDKNKEEELSERGWKRFALHLHLPGEP